MTNQIKSINSLNNLINYFNKSNIYNLDNLLEVKKVLIRLSKTITINNIFKNKTKKLNKIIDNSVLHILIDRINIILSEYLNSLPDNIENAQKSDSIENTNNMIKKIHNMLSKYYIDLQYCYNLNLNNPGLKDKMDGYLGKYNLKIPNEKFDYYSSIGYDKCDVRILQNIRCCMRVIIFLSVRFNYYTNIGLLTTKNVKVITKKGSFFSKEEFKLVQRNMLKSEFIKELSIMFREISEYNITNFEKLRKIIGCDYYWSNNNTKKILINGECKFKLNL